MATKKNTNREDIISTLKEISNNYNETPLAMHIALACQEYDSIDLISDREFSYLLTKYLSSKELDIASQIIQEDFLFDDDPFGEEEDDYEY